VTKPADTSLADVAALQHRQNRLLIGPFAMAAALNKKTSWRRRITHTNVN